MAQTKDSSATSTPKVFIAMAVALAALRALTGVIAIASPQIATKPVAWIQPAVEDVEMIKPIEKPKAVEEEESPLATIPHTGKPLILEFYANWSDPCKRMEQTCLSNKQISELITENFTPVRITDMSHEKGKNPQWIADLEKQHRVFALPTLVIVDTKGRTAGSLIGNCSSLTTYRFLSRAIHNHPAH